jgi:hypothetical protein
MSSKMSSTLVSAKTKPVTEQEAYAIGVEAYTFFYPLITMEITRRQMTNVKAGEKPGFGPMNAFHHMPAYPDADMRSVVRPNFDTLYSIAYLDLTAGPVVFSIPDTNGRYYLMPMLDMWTDVFASPGWRTSGTGEQEYVIVPPGWSGELPADMERIDAPTPYVWVIGRIKTDGPSDYAAVNKIQSALTISHLTDGRKTAVTPLEKIDSSIDMKTPPLDQVNKMPAGQYLALGAQLLGLHPAHKTDWSTMIRLQRVGIEAGKKFDFDALESGIKSALERGAADGLKLMFAKMKLMGRPENGWNMNTDTMGVYGNYYLKRAIVTMLGLGANQPEDAVYPLSITDDQGKTLFGDNNYVLHFDQDNLPPVEAFWSVTMYDKDGFQCANSINRFAISSWMPLVKNGDGSIDLYLQHENPGAGKEANWLPAPKGELGVTMRLYAPKPPVLTGDWNPPAIKHVK